MKPNLILAVFAASLISISATAQSLPDLGGRTIVVVTENTYPPLQFLTPEGVAMSWEYDAMNDIAARLNFTVTYKTFGWPGVFAAVASGEADISMDGFPYMERHAALVAPRKMPPLLVVASARAETARTMPTQRPTPASATTPATAP